MYNFANLPQNLMQNPGAEIDYKWHLGVPLLSRVSFDTGSTGAGIMDIIDADNLSINDKVRDLISKTKDNDFLELNQQLDVFNVGIGLKKNGYISFGLYQELDAIFYYPKSMMQLFYEGSVIAAGKHQLNGINTKIEFLGVWHVGFSKKINKKLTLGGRLKLYSGVANFQTKNNSGFFQTEETNNVVQHIFDAIDLSTQTSGVVLEDYKNLGVGYFFKKLLYSGNVGLGIDAGFTYNISNKFQVSGSLLDFGSISYKKNVESYSINGDHILEEIQATFEEEHPIEYWEEFIENFQLKMPIDTIYSPYTSKRPIKINAAMQYRFKDKHNKYSTTIKDYYANTTGIQVFSVFRDNKAKLATTLFYERRFGKTIHTKITYTADSFSYKNIGLGFSGSIKKFNMYLVVDNLLNFADFKKARSASVQLGVNIIVNR